MKKLIFTFIALLFFVACRNQAILYVYDVVELNDYTVSKAGETPYDSEQEMEVDFTNGESSYESIKDIEYAAPTDEEPQHNRQTYVEIEGRIREIRAPGTLSIEDLLYDLNYMVYVLENNFALLCVAYWMHNVDYKVLEENARRLVLTMHEPCEDTFLAIIFYSFMPLFITGHFAIYDHLSFINHRTHFYPRGYSGLIATMNRQLMHSPLANRFYTGENERKEMFNAALNELIESYGPLENRAFLRTTPPPPFATEIIQEGHIASITISSMLDISPNLNTINHFFREIRDFEHLILDLRSNFGGEIHDFLEFIVRPTLSVPIYAPKAFIFFMEGPYIRSRLGDYLFIPTMSSGYLTIIEPERPASDILEMFSLPGFNHNDVERLHYGALASRIPRQLRPRNPDFIGPDFDGKIWILTDRFMFSGAQLAAWYSKETGFDTLVGDITGGGIGGPRTMSLMPNTGILFQFDIFYITDSFGRPLEAGTIPHHFNLPGLDALETVLILIKESTY